MNPVPLILDTDMGNDIDDALALAMIHTLQSRGECELLGVSISKDNLYAAAYVDLLNTFYGRGDIPIGLVRNGATPGAGKYIQQVAEARDTQGRPVFARTVGALEMYGPAVAMLRRQLQEADEASVTIVMIGFSTNMARLLDSSPDAISPLDGAALLARKVKRVVMMAGDFSPAALAHPSRENAEYNIHIDAPSARQFIDHCPVPIFFTGFEIGLKIAYPATSIEQDFKWARRHPVVEGYRLYQSMPYDRPSWDLTAVLFAVRPDRGCFGLSPHGKVAVNEDGSVGFKIDPAGQHQYMTVNREQVALIGSAHIELASAPLNPHASLP